MRIEFDYTSLLLPVLVALPAWYWLRGRSKRVLPYPPGPKGYPLIGNLLDFPADVPLWEGLAGMAKQHGRVLPPGRHSGRNMTLETLGTDVLRLELPSMEMVVLSTSEAISDLLDQRSAIYSDKVRAVRPVIGCHPLMSSPAVYPNDRVVSLFDGLC